ncbi:MAG: aldolase/citrate lyase family protein [Candidatus Latescibacteria bacterium]|nr:aldolase/citrate lyase family protein [Candidatus Latescibacterota bacterium]|tara:strand:- start:17 stop:814 length:798 start_codon:yes stop_codon:yes gene_type:complete
MTNRLKQRLDEGSAAIGIQLRFGSPAIAEMAGLAGFDWLLLDAEHSPQTAPGIQTQLQAIGCTDSTAIVRLGRGDPDQIRLYLDMGAMGIAVPFISTAEEARACADACRYPPRGTRGWGPHRAGGYGLHAERYTARIDDEVLFFPIIETATAIENIDAIMAVDGVDSCIVGPVDLCYSLGIPFQFDHPDFLSALDRVRDASNKAGKPSGLPLLGSVEDRANVDRQVVAGARLLLVGCDEPALGNAFTSMLEPLSHLQDQQRQRSE